MPKRRRPSRHIRRMRVGRGRTRIKRKLINPHIRKRIRASETFQEFRKRKAKELEVSEEDYSRLLADGLTEEKIGEIRKDILKKRNIGSHPKIYVHQSEEAVESFPSGHQMVEILRTLPKEKQEEFRKEFDKPGIEPLKAFQNIGIDPLKVLFQKRKNFGFMPKSKKEVEKAVESMKIQGLERDPLFREAMFVLEKPESAMEEIKGGTEQQRKLAIDEQQLLTRRPEFFMTPEDHKKLKKTLEFRSATGKKAAITSAFRRIDDAERRIKEIEGSLLPRTHPGETKRKIDLHRRTINMARKVIERDDS